MTLRLNKTLGSFYCQTALRLCLEARKMCKTGECNKVAEVCSFVSTLCSQNSFETCSKESSMCEHVATYCRSGQNSEDCINAQIICDEAKKLCPQNNTITGS